MERERFKALVLRLRGSVNAATGNFAIDLSKSCETPVVSTWSAPPGDPDAPSKGVSPDGEVVDFPSGWLVAEATVPCRRCWACGRAKAFSWSLRVQNELAAHPKTEFITMTFRREQRRSLLAEAAIVLADNPSFDNGKWYLPEDEVVERAERVLVTCSGRFVTRAIKRLRERVGQKLRFVGVAELHPSRPVGALSGVPDWMPTHKLHFPHWHLLVHAPVDTRPTFTEQRELWRDVWKEGGKSIGFIHNETVDCSDDYQAAAWYICKYMHKSIQSRIRNSIHYGKPG